MIKLKEIRIEHNMSQKEVAEHLNVARSTYSVWDIGSEMIPLKHLICFCNLFEISIDFVFGFTKKTLYINPSLEINPLIIGNRLKEFRKENKLTQDKLAKILNTTQTVIAGYESGRRLIATPFLYEICKKYSISADYLLGRIDNPKYLK